MKTRYSAEAPARDELDRLAGPTLVEFGTDWCGHCQAAQPLLAEVFSDYPEVGHLKVEDGPGRRLGRSFQVKLWPTLVFLRDGLWWKKRSRAWSARAEDPARGPGGVQAGIA